MILIALASTVCFVCIARMMGESASMRSCKAGSGLTQLAFRVSGSGSRIWFTV